MKNKIKKIVFLDRDGVINKKAAEHKYITKVEDFVVNKGIFKMLEVYRRKGYEFIIITNQRGIARGILNENDLKLIHDHMFKIFEDGKLDLLDIFYCSHNADVCNCRKPKPGLLKQALKKYNIDLEQSVLISDSNLDVEMGKMFGIGKNILVRADSLEVIDSQ